MDVSNRKLRRIYRAYVSGIVRAAKGECPSVEHLREAFEGTMSRAAKDEIVDHISGCPDCAREFEFIRKVRKGERDLAEGMQALSRHRRPSGPFFFRPLWNYTLGAAMIAVIISGLVVFLHEHRQDEGRSRPAERPKTLVPSGRIEAPPPLIFRWKPVNRAVSYIVEIYDESLQLIWESPPVSTAATLLPEAIKKTLSGDTNYYWSVLALDSEGKFCESRFEIFSIDR